MNSETIEKYIDGELEPQELLKFEELLEKDSHLRRDYKLSLEVNNALIEDDVMNLRETLNSMYKNDTKVKRLPNRFAKRKLYYAAASFALLIATGSLVHKYSMHDLSGDELFHKYYQPYEVAVTYRSGNAELDKIFLSALQKYEEKDFEKALMLFEEVLEKRTDDMALNLYSGISYMEVEKYKEATHSFNTIIDNSNNLFVEQAKWFLALCYLITDENENAINLLTQIKDEDSYYSKQASKMLREISN